MHARSIQDLAQDCAQAQASPRSAPPNEEDACYELFRRAFASPSDEDAWQAIVDQYRRLVWHWLGQHASDDTLQDVLLRLLRAGRKTSPPFSTRFPDSPSIMGYLKACAASVRVEAWRAEERQRQLWQQLSDKALVEAVAARSAPQRGHDDFHFKQLVLSKLKDERERIVFELSYYYGLAPRQIQAERADIFPDASAVNRVKHNILKRLRRDPDLNEEWPRRRRT
jgi:DNA-directed RNA polymerase specialized sigma24 family protein